MVLTTEFIGFTAVPIGGSSGPVLVGACSDGKVGDKKSAEGQTNVRGFHFEGFWEYRYETKLSMDLFACHAHTALTLNLADHKHTPIMKYVMTLMMAALLMTTATAQEKKGEMTEAKSAAEMLTERMTTELGLDAAQAKEVQAINVKYAEKALGRASAKANLETRSGDPEAMVEMNGALKEVLTPDQYEQWIKAQEGKKNTTPDGRKINSVQEVE